MLISEKTRVSLCEIIGKCFEMNRFLDRGMSLIDTKWKMRNCSEKLHPALAHAFLGDMFADGIGKYMSDRDSIVYYPATPIGNEDYESPLNFFSEFLKRMIEFQNYVYDVMEDVVEEGDHSTKIFLDGLNKNIVSFIAQAQLLVDIFSKYGSTESGLLIIDTNIEKYITV